MNPDTLKRMTGLRRGEARAVLTSAAYFFCVLCGYYMLRPLREEMGLAGGVDNLPWLFMATLGAMLLATPLFGALVDRFPRRVFIPAAYRFFALNLLIFYALMHWLPAGAERHLGRVFYVWLSVFNMFAVSLFWAFMADGFGLERSKRLFGLIAVGGTLGAIAGAGMTAGLVGVLGRATMLLPAAVMLEAAVQCVRALCREFGLAGTTARPAGENVPTAAPEARRMRGGALNGIRLAFGSPYLLAICGYLFLYSLSSTFLYFEQAHIVAAAVAERAARAALFARIDLWVNVLTLAVQLAATGRVLSRLGVGLTLASLPALSALGFGALAAAPTLAVLVVFQVVRRAANYALIRPARETLYTIVPLEHKYKAKSFIDTFVYRGGDALGATLFGGLTGLGLYF